MEKGEHNVLFLGQLLFIILLMTLVSKTEIKLDSFIEDLEIMGNVNFDKQI